MCYGVLKASWFSINLHTSMNNFDGKQPSLFECHSVSGSYLNTQALAICWATSGAEIPFIHTDFFILLKQSVKRCSMRCGVLMYSKRIAFHTDDKGDVAGTFWSFVTLFRSFLLFLAHCGHLRTAAQHYTANAGQ